MLIKELFIRDLMIQKLQDKAVPHRDLYERHRNANVKQLKLTAKNI